jgi:hypothetical protein
MRRKIRAQVTTNRVMVLVLGVLFAIAWAVPSIGASAGKVARTALARANLAVHDSDVAVSQSNTAKSTASAANNTANAANSLANTANSTANQALTKANSIVPSSFARMNQPCNTSSACSIDHARGVTGIRQTGADGTYCVTVSGRSQSTAAWVASVDAGDTGGTLADAVALPVSGSPDCSSLFGEFEVKTMHGSSADSNISFFVAIP